MRLRTSHDAATPDKEPDMVVHLSPEDMKNCGLVRKGDKGWEGAARVLSAFAAGAVGFMKGGPLGAIVAAKERVDMIAEGADKD